MCVNFKFVLNFLREGRSKILILQFPMFSNNKTLGKTLNKFPPISWKLSSPVTLETEAILPGDLTDLS